MTYKEQETTSNNLKQPRVTKKRRTFYLIVKLISKVFDLIFFMGVAFISSSESWRGSASMEACRSFMKAGPVRLSAAPVVI